MFFALDRRSKNILPAPFSLSNPNDSAFNNTLLKIQPLSFHRVVFSSTRFKPATRQKNGSETKALKL
jgi:hypothetical protein